MNQMKPTTMLIIIFAILVLFMKNGEGQTATQSIQGVLDVFTQNPILLVLIGLFVFMMLSEKKSGQPEQITQA